MAATVEPDRIAQVRAIWAAYARGGVEAVRRVAGQEVEWLPRGRDQPAGLKDDGPDVSAVVHALESHGSCVLALGGLRTFRAGGFVDVQPSWVYFFSGTRLVRVEGFSTREAALAAIAAHRLSEAA